jgi:periplasmic protein CpxP/Spy
MKKQFLSLTLCAFFGLGAALAAQAPQDQPAAQPAPQANGQRPVDPNRQLQVLTKKLNLSADQQSQLLPILTDRKQQMAAIRSDTSLSREDRHAKMTALRQDSKNKVESVLNAGQKQTYEQMQQHPHHKDAPTN